MLEGMYGRAAEAQPAMGGGSRRSRRGGLVWAAGGRRRQEIEDTVHDRCQNPNLSRSCSLSYENLQPI